MTATQRRRTPRPRSRHDVQDATATAVIASKGRTATAAMHDGRRLDTATIVHSHITRNHGIQRNAPARYHTTRQPNKHSSEQTFDRTHVPMLHIRQTPRWGSVPPGQKAGAAGSLVLTLNARWNIFGLPVTYEVFTYLVVATVSAPYILCIMVFGLMLMMVERSSGLHQYLTAITHCA